MCDNKKWYSVEFENFDEPKDSEPILRHWIVLRVLAGSQTISDENDLAHELQDLFRFAFDNLIDADPVRFYPGDVDWDVLARELRFEAQDVLDDEDSDIDVGFVEVMKILRPWPDGSRFRRGREFRVSKKKSRGNHANEMRASA